MSPQTFRPPSCVLLVPVLLAGCVSPRPKAAPAPAVPQAAQVRAALGAFEGAVRAMASEALVGFYEETATVSHGQEPAIVGRPAIRSLLAAFRDCKVLAYDLVPETLTLGPGIAEQGGRYQQTVLTPDGRRLEVRGTFRATWRVQPDGRLLLSALHTE